MNYPDDFEDAFESTPHYREIVVKKFLFQINIDLLTECGFLKPDLNRLDKEIKTTLIEQNEKYINYNINCKSRRINNWKDFE